MPPEPPASDTPGAAGTAAPEPTPLQAHPGRRGGGSPRRSPEAPAARAARSPVAGQADLPCVPEAGARLGHFVLLKRLGAGGMGVVFAAFDTRLERKVALKVVQPEVLRCWGAAGRARLVREAQAMAKLSHPNVVTIHAVGLDADQPFLAMEFVDGQTLRAWLDAGPRPVREVLGIFIQAGRGLAAAHGKGLVHRDFKPDNVLVDRAGHVRVTDFGLVVQADEQAEASEGTGSDPGAAEATGVGGVGVGVTPLLLTTEGALLGTPGYIAPEQYLGGRGLDARVDQFAFCAALFEALYGRRPFDGGSAEATRANVLTGRVCRLPSARVPAALRAALLRGLAVEPAARFPSMEALLQVLERSAAGRLRRRLLVAGAAVLLATLGGAGVLWQRSQAGVCGGAAQRLAGVWDGAARAAVDQALRASGRAHAADAAVRVEQALDGYAHAWVAMHSQACMATAVRKEQSPQLLDLRMACLDGRRDELAAAVRLLSTPTGGQVVDKAVQVATGLTPLDGCADVQSLRSAFPPPAEAAARAHVARATASLEDVRALERAGRLKDALAQLEAQLPALQALEHPPLQANALALQGTLQLGLLDARAAEATLSRAVERAAAARDDVLLVESGSNLIRSLQLQARYAEALALRPLVEASLVRAAAPPPVRARLLAALADVHRADGRPQEADALYAQAIQLFQQGGAAATEGLARLVVGRAIALRQRGDFARARAVLEQARALTDQAVGPRHPLMGTVETELGALARESGQHASALVHLERALAIREGAFGADSPQVAQALMNTTPALRDLQRYDAARRALERALRIFETKLGPTHPDTAWVLGGQGSLASALGRHEEARGLYLRERAIYEKAHPGPNPYVGRSSHSIGQSLLAQGRCGDALPEFRRSLAGLEAALGPAASDLGYPLLGLGKCLRLRGRPDQAVPFLERAVAVRSGHGINPQLTAEAQLALAQALWHQRGARTRALALARQARDTLATASTAAMVSLRDEAAAWLAERERPTPARRAATAPAP